MKKILKSRLLFFIIGIVISLEVTKVLAYSLVASNVEYIPTETSFNVNNVSSALDSLYDTMLNHETVEFIANYAYSHHSLTIEPRDYKYFILTNVFWNSTGKIYSAALGYLQISTITNGRYYLVGTTGRDGSKSGCATRTYMIIPDKRNANIEITFGSNSDGTSIYGVKDSY